MQQDLQAGTKTLHAFEDQAVRFDMMTQRNIGSGNVVFNANKNTDLIINVRSTNRNGSIPFGGTFGFSNAVELPAPIDTHTTDVQTALELANQRGMFRVGLGRLVVQQRHRADRVGQPAALRSRHRRHVVSGPDELVGR